ncbi:MAG: glycine C-acetyltransferase [Saprospiraceae bacterium]|nr:glycine C-acetyltransferase [Saprospiraceae bacterium]
MIHSVQRAIREELQAIRDEGLYKEERIITSPQGAEIQTTHYPEVLNFCANNYLGLSSHPTVISAAKDAIDKYGYGLSSVRFICGTQTVHKQLEHDIAQFLGMEDAILYAAAFDANGGLFEPLLTAEDAIISDQLNHASIIDGIRLCKAARYRYINNDMADLEDKLKESQSARRRMIATDGVFSMDGVIAQVGEICNLAEKYDAMVMVDDCHATGFIGRTGRGSHEYSGAICRVDIITGTFGKALGGASGGFTAASKEVVEMLRQRSRPYLFSNTLAPAIAGASIEVLKLISSSTFLRDKLEENTRFFRTQMQKVGFDIISGVHPIVPIMLYDAKLSQAFSQALLAKGIYVIGFFYPVVPKDKARIRVQISAAHERTHLEKAVEAFTEVGKELGVIS